MGTIKYEQYIEAFNYVRRCNRDRFLNYCHIGTIIKHNGSKTNWEIVEILDTKTVGFDNNFLSSSSQPPYVKTKEVVIQSMNSTKSGKRYKKRFIVEDGFYRYDIVSVSKAVKVLWGDPKDNPPKSPNDYYEPTKPGAI